MHKIFKPLQLIWQLPRYAKILLCIFVGIPLIIGYVMVYLVTMNVYVRTHPGVTPTVQGITYTVDTPIPGDVIKAQVDHLIDSLQKLQPISYEAKLPPFALFTELVPSTGLTARLLHCRLWCSCRQDLPTGSFQLLVFQLFPTAQSYTLVADTVMSYEDYAKPFNLQTAI